MGYSTWGRKEVDTTEVTCTLIGCGLWSPQIIKERQRSLMTDHHKNIIIVKRFEILKEFQECDAQT